jgi:hypothetical protein
MIMCMLHYYLYFHMNLPNTIGSKDISSTLLSVGAAFEFWAERRLGWNFGCNIISVLLTSIEHLFHFFNRALKLTM